MEVVEAPTLDAFVPVKGIKLKLETTYSDPGPRPPPPPPFPQSRGPSWAARPNEPSGFRGRKAVLNYAHQLVSACP